MARRSTAGTGDAAPCSVGRAPVLSPPQPAAPAATREATAFLQDALAGKNGSFAADVVLAMFSQGQNPLAVVQRVLNFRAAAARREPESSDESSDSSDESGSDSSPSPAPRRRVRRTSVSDRLAQPKRVTPHVRDPDPHSRYDFASNLRGGSGTGSSPAARRASGAASPAAGSGGSRAGPASGAAANALSPVHARRPSGASGGGSASAAAAAARTEVAVSASPVTLQMGRPSIDIGSLMSPRLFGAGPHSGASAAGLASGGDAGVASHAGKHRASVDLRGVGIGGADSAGAPATTERDRIRRASGASSAPDIASAAAAGGHGALGGAVALHRRSSTESVVSLQGSVGGASISRAVAAGAAQLPPLHHSPTKAHHRESRDSLASLHGGSVSGVALSAAFSAATQAAGGNVASGPLAAGSLLLGASALGLAAASSALSGSGNAGSFPATSRPRSATQPLAPISPTTAGGGGNVIASSGPRMRPLSGTGAGAGGGAGGAAAGRALAAVGSPTAAAATARPSSSGGVGSGGRIYAAAAAAAAGGNNNHDGTASGSGFMLPLSAMGTALVGSNRPGSASARAPSPLRRRTVSSSSLLALQGSGAALNPGSPPGSGHHHTSSSSSSAGGAALLPAQRSPPLAMGGASPVGAAVGDAPNAGLIRGSPTLHPVGAAVGDAPNAGLVRGSPTLHPVARKSLFDPASSSPPASSSSASASAAPASTVGALPALVEASAAHATAAPPTSAPASASPSTTPRLIIKIVTPDGAFRAAAPVPLQQLTREHLATMAAAKLSMQQQQHASSPGDGSAATSQQQRHVILEYEEVAGDSEPVRLDCDDDVELALPFFAGLIAAGKDVRIKARFAGMSGAFRSSNALLPTGSAASSSHSDGSAGTAADERSERLVSHSSSAAGSSSTSVPGSSPLPSPLLNDGGGRPVTSSATAVSSSSSLAAEVSETNSPALTPSTHDAAAAAAAVQRASSDDDAAGHGAENANGSDARLYSEVPGGSPVPLARRHSAVAAFGSPAATRAGTQDAGLAAGLDAGLDAGLAAGLAAGPLTTGRASSNDDASGLELQQRRARSRSFAGPPRSVGGPAPSFLSPGGISMPGFASPGAGPYSAYPYPLPSSHSHYHHHQHQHQQQAALPVRLVREAQRGGVLGAGSFGTVFAGIDVDTGAPIAIKEVKIVLPASAAARLGPLADSGVTLDAAISPTLSSPTATHAHAGHNGSGSGGVGPGGGAGAVPVPVPATGRGRSASAAAFGVTSGPAVEPLAELERLCREDSKVRALQREIAFLSKIQHENIIRYVIA